MQTNQIVSLVLLLSGLSVITNAVVEVASSLLPNDFKGRDKVLLLLSMVVGVSLTVPAGADVTNLVGISVGVYGSVLSGILVSRGANFLNDKVFAQLKALKDKPAENVINVDPVHVTADSLDDAINNSIQGGTKNV